MAEKKEKFTEFRKLLREGIGSRTQKEFAEAAGITKEHVNRMLNAETINRPTLTTLKSIAEQMSKVTLSELMAACGYEIIPMKDRILKQESLLAAGFEDPSVKGIPWKSLDDMLYTLDSLFLEEPTKFNVLKTGESTAREPGEEYAVVEAHWGDSEFQFTTVMLLYYCTTAKGNTILLGYSLDPEILKQNQFFQTDPGLKRTWLKYWDNGLTGCSIGKQVKPGEKSIEERMLEAIFGHRETYTSVIPGFGFYYHETPAGFVDFLIAHRAAFCINKERSEMYQRVVLQGEDPDEVFEEFEDPYTEYTGTGAVVSEIMKREVQPGFAYWKKADENDDAPDDSCIMVEANSKKEQDRLVNIVYQAAKLLQIPEFGTVYHKCKLEKENACHYKTSEYHIEFR